MTLDEAMAYANDGEGLREIEDTCDALDVLQAEAVRLRGIVEKGLDYEHHSSCGHVWTMRHTACPECFAQMKADLHALENKCVVSESAYVQQLEADLAAEVHRLRMCFDEPMETLADMRLERDVLRLNLTSMQKFTDEIKAENAALRRRFADMEARRNALFEEATALRQRHAEAVKLLADVEWAGTDSVYLTRFCVWCDENEKHGHADNCRYVALLAKARLT